MCLRHKYCHWARQSAIITSVEGGEGSFLASTAATLDKVAIAVTSATAMTTTIADESCARAVAAKDKPSDPD